MMKAEATNGFKKHTSIIKKHTDANGNTIIKNIEDEFKQVVHSHVVLEQIPHSLMNFEVYLVTTTKNLNRLTGDYSVDQSFTRLTMIEHTKTILNENQYKVDFTEGKVWVHPDLEGKILSLNYWGEGYSLIHTSRVYTQLDENGDIVETLETLMEAGYECLKFLGDYPSALEEGRFIREIIESAGILKFDLMKSIEEGSLLHTNLSDAYAVARELLDSLVATIPNAQILDESLAEKIAQGSTLDVDLNGKIIKAEQLLKDTATANDILTNLKETIDKSKDLVEELNKHDNILKNFTTEEWTDGVIRWEHGLGSVNLILACYDSSDMNIQVRYKIIDSNTIEFYCDSNLEFKVVVNVAYRGVDGSADGGSNLTQSQIDNINHIPNLKVDIAGLKTKDEEAAAVIRELSTRILNTEVMLDDNFLIKTIERLSKEKDHTINSKTVDNVKLQNLIGMKLVNVDYPDSYGIGRYEEDGTYNNLDPLRIPRMGLMPYHASGNNHSNGYMCNLGATDRRFNGVYAGTGDFTTVEAGAVNVKNGALAVGSKKIFCQSKAPTTGVKGDIWIKTY